MPILTDVSLLHHMAHAFLLDINQEHVPMKREDVLRSGLIPASSISLSCRRAVNKEMKRNSPTKTRKKMKTLAGIPVDLSFNNFSSLICSCSFLFLYYTSK